MLPVVPLALAAALCAVLLGGCLDEPEIDKRWTLVEFLSTDPRPVETVAAGTTVPVAVSGRITYRAIRTGYLVAEVRYAADLPPSAVGLDPDDHTLATSRHIEQVLAASVTAGRATRAVTGFDHLVQEIDFAFDAVVPAEMASGDPDSLARRGLYLVLYLGEGEEIELPAGRDSLVVTPLPVDEYELLLTGFALDVTASTGGTP